MIIGLFNPNHPTHKKLLEHFQMTKCGEIWGVTLFDPNQKISAKKLKEIEQIYYTFFCIDLCQMYMVSKTIHCPIVAMSFRPQLTVFLLV